MANEKELFELLDHPAVEHSISLDSIFSEDAEAPSIPADNTAKTVNGGIVTTDSGIVTAADTEKTTTPREPIHHGSLSRFGGKSSELRLLLDLRDPARSLHTDVLIALLPLLLWAIYLYGLRPLTLTVLAVLASIGWEALCRRLFRRIAPPDLTPVITGVILACGLPPSAPLWLPILGSLIAILPIRQLFGGTGRNRINPAAFALGCLHIAFPSLMTAIPATGQRLSAFAFAPKGFALAERSVLDTLLGGFLPETSFGSLFFGLRAGTIGEMSAFLLVAALIYLLWRRILRFSLPLTYVIAIAALAFAFPSLTAASDITALHGSLYHILDSNTLFAAIFLLGDPVTTPKSSWGAILAGFFGGVVTFSMRLIATPAVSAIAAVLVINVLAPLLDRFFGPTPFGGYRKTKE